MGAVIPKLVFDSRCGTNVALVNDGSALVKLNKAEVGNSVGITNRNLQVDELFRVTIDGDIIPEQSFRIAVITTGPSNKPYPTSLLGERCLEKNYTVVFDGKDVWQNDRKTFPDYYIGIFKAGDRVGVKVTNTGAIHFYKNNKDLGPAASNAPENIYGAFEIGKNIPRVTIVDQKMLPSVFKFFIFLAIGRILALHVSSWT